LVVKEKRGRKRYILFEHTKKVELNHIKMFLKQNSELINGKIRWRIITFEKEKSIILVDHTKSHITRNLIEENREKLGIKPIKTSGTLKALQK
tara:strand:- start:264 stop:542 length:279 start_codon:yes stop_codon:yes gene_type:complete